MTIAALQISANTITADSIIAPKVTADGPGGALVQRALVQVNGDNILTSSGAVTEMTNIGTGGTGYDLDVPVGTGANAKSSPSGAMVLYGAATDFVSTPDSAAIGAITESFDVIVYVAPDDWTPSVAGRILCQDFAGSRVLNTMIVSGGGLQIEAYDSVGGSFGIPASTVATGFTNGTGHWLRFKFTWASSGNTLTDYYTSDEAVSVDTTTLTWSPLGSQRSAAATGNALGSSSRILTIGQREYTANENPFLGTIYQAQLWNGHIDDSGTLATDFLAADQTDPAATTFVSSATGETWTQNGNAFIQNTGHQVVDTIASVALESTAGQDIASEFTMMFVARFKDSSPGADQFLFDSRSDAAKSVRVFSDFSNSDKWTLDCGGTPKALTEAYDNDFHVFTIQQNADATTRLTVSGVGSVTGDAGTETLDYMTLFGDLSGANTGPLVVGEGIIWNFELDASQIATGQNYLADRYSL